MSGDDVMVPASVPSAAATAVEHVLQHLRNGVRLGRYAPGQRLPEVDMIRELGVSRGPLREALARLAAEGVVEIKPYCGATVKRLTEVDLRELYEVREVLEGQAAALAASQVAARVDATALTRELHRLEEAKQRANARAYMAENIAFHDLVVRLSGSRLLSSLIAQLHTNTFRLQLINLIPLDGLDASALQHAEITRAVLAGDEKEAERAMRHHVRESYLLMLHSAAPLLG